MKGYCCFGRVANRSSFVSSAFCSGVTEAGAAALEGAREAASYCRHQLLCASRDGVSLRLENFPLGQVERRPSRPRKCPESDA